MDERACCRRHCRSSGETSNFFKACLVTVGWFTIRSGERNTEDMERAYIFGTPQNDSRQSVGGNTFVEILLRNYGRTPGHLWRGFPATNPSATECIRTAAQEP